MVRRGFALSKEKANAVIMAGEVLVNSQVVYKSDKIVRETDHIELKEKFPYVSRGALKIEKAFKDFSIPLKGSRVLDIGISTGGFTDYMLKQGVEQAVGVDVNIDQVDHELRKNERLTLIKENARDLKRDKIGFDPDIITMDVSFISVTKILPALSQFKGSKILTLIKPQFEAKREHVGKGGIVRDKEKRIEVLLTLKQRIIELNYSVLAFTPSGVKGRKGNKEYFFLLKYGKIPSINDKIITDAIKSEL